MEPLRVAVARRVGLDHTDDVFERHNVHGLDVTGLAQPGAKQPVSKVLLFRIHFGEGDPIAFISVRLRESALGEIVPIRAVGGVELEKPSSAAENDR